MFFAFVLHSYTSMFVKEEKNLGIFISSQKKLIVFILWHTVCICDENIRTKMGTDCAKESISSFKILLCTLFLI